MSNPNILNIDISDIKTPSDAKIAYWKGVALEKNQEYNKALIAYKKASKFNHPSALGNLAAVYLNEQNNDLAIQIFKMGIEKNDYASTHNLGHLYQNLNQDENAKQYFQKAIDTDVSRCGPSYHSLAQIFEKEENIVKAIEYYQKSIDANSPFKLIAEEKIRELKTKHHIPL